jgi:hypothetical protein
MNYEGTRVIVAIPGLGDLPGISRNVVLGVEEALLDVELLLPGGADKICCILCSRHLREMEATVRCVAVDAWQAAIANALQPPRAPGSERPETHHDDKAPDTLPCPPTEEPGGCALPPDPVSPMFDEVEPEALDGDWSDV